MEGGFLQYALRSESKLHCEDTKYVSCYSASLILSASRDNSGCISFFPEKEEPLSPPKYFIGHQAFVNFLLFHPGIPLLNESECLVSGSNDNHIILWNPVTCTLEAVLDGHSKGVTCGTLLSNVPLNERSASWEGDILSGDWAGTCIVFDCVSGKPKQVYDKHQVAIRGICQLPETSLAVSCSGDKTAHVWNITSGETVQICKFHLDVVQCVCAIDSCTFATGSNDCTIGIWKVGICTPICTLEGHSSLVYGLSWNKHNNQLLSCSEDRSVIVWGDKTSQRNLQNFEPLQAVPHPTLVWSVCALACGDFLTGTSDGYVRAWTQSHERRASPEAITAFNCKVASQKIDARTNSNDVTSGSLPSVNDLDKYTGKEGTKKMFRSNNGEVELYIMTAGKWEKLGVVVSGPDQSPITGNQLPTVKKNYRDKEFDYLFDIDANGKMLQLPYNRGECVISAAKKLINENPTCLSMNHFEEIKDFILKNISEEDRKVVGQAQPIKTTEILPFTEFEKLWKFNFRGAQQKVNEILGEGNPFSTIMEAVNNEEDCSEKLLNLCSKLPSRSRFPAIDALRFSLCRKDIKSETIVLICERFLHLSKEFTEMSPLETVAIIQFLFTTLEVVSHEQHSLIEPRIINLLLEFLEKKDVISSEKCKTTPHIEKATINFLKNSSMFIIKSLEGNCPSIEHVDMLGTFLILFCISAFSVLEQPILSTMLTLYNTSSKALPQKLQDTSSLGKDFFPQLKQMALTSDDSEVRRVCTVLLNLI